MEITALTLEFVGTLMIAYAALKVHYRFHKEHKVDEKVFVTMRREMGLGVAGVALLAMSFVLNIVTM